MLYLADEVKLASTSISNYVWAFRSWTKLQRQLDPAYGVIEWHDFMQSISVECWQPSEPRKEVPVWLLRKALEAVDVNVFWEVQMAFLILLLFFTFARSETPCPATFAASPADGGFDTTKHTQVRDIKLEPVNNRRCLHARLKSIKQDPRLERPQAQGNEDWIIVGDLDDPSSIFSIFKWVQILFQHHGRARPDDAPFFLDPDRVRHLTYGNALKQFRRLLSRVVGEDEAKSYGLHGLRVSGYNCARRINRELAVAQGAWESAAHERYDRFTAAEISALPGSMIALASSGDDPRFAAPSQVPAPPAILTVGPSAPVAPPPPPPAALPAVRQRIRVFWTDMDEWFSATVTSHRAEGSGPRATRVVYDVTPQFPRARENVFWHDLSTERWEALPAQEVLLLPAPVDTVAAAAVPPVTVAVPALPVPRAEPLPLSRSGRVPRPVARLPASLPGEWSSSAPL